LHPVNISSMTIARHATSRGHVLSGTEARRASAGHDDFRVMRYQEH